MRTYLTLKDRESFEAEIDPSGIAVEVSSGGNRMFFSAAEVERFLRWFSKAGWFKLDNSTTKRSRSAGTVGAYYLQRFKGSVANSSRFVAVLVDERYLAFDRKGKGGGIFLKVLRDSF